MKTTMSRNNREGKYVGMLGYKHVRDIFWTKKERLSTTFPRSRKQLKQAWIQPQNSFDIPF